MVWQSRRQDYAKEIIGLLYDGEMIKTWFKDKPDGWVLVSKLWSPFYIQLRLLGSKPNSKILLRKIGMAMGELIKKEVPNVNKTVGVMMAGIPIATAITICSGIPSCCARKLDGIKTPAEFDENILSFDKELKRYGEHSLIEGDISNGDNILIIDDLVTKFDSKLVTQKQIYYEAKKRGVDVNCNEVAVLLDREQGASDIAEKNGMKLHSLIRFKSEGIDLLKGKISDLEYNIITDYLENPQKYQDKALQQELASCARN